MSRGEGSRIVLWIMAYFVRSFVCVCVCVCGGVVWCGVVWGGVVWGVVCGVVIGYD